MFNPNTKQVGWGKLWFCVIFCIICDTETETVPCCQGKKNQKKKPQKSRTDKLHYYLSVCVWICARLCPGSVVNPNCSFAAFPSCLPGLVTGHGSHWSLSWTEVWPRFRDTLGTTSIWTSITGVLVRVWMLGRGWGMVTEVEPSVTIYV